MNRKLPQCGKIRIDSTFSMKSVNQSRWSATGRRSEKKIEIDRNFDAGTRCFIGFMRVQEIGMQRRTRARRQAGREGCFKM